MNERRRPRVAVVDYGVGNLFSVQNACRHAGLDSVVTASRTEIHASDAIILPGVGAFGDAMAQLRRLDLTGALRDAALSGKPLVGICLGMQLLMTESLEFGRHEGLGLVPGRVVRLEGGAAPRPVKVPQVGWNRMEKPAPGTGGDPWAGTLLQRLPDGVHMYFVHSYFVQPEDETVAIAWTRYGPQRFCSALQRGNIFACQGHPERSGPRGLLVYHNLASTLRAGH